LVDPRVNFEIIGEEAARRVIDADVAPDPRTKVMAEIHNYLDKALNEQGNWDINRREAIDHAFNAAYLMGIYRNTRWVAIPEYLDDAIKLLAESVKQFNEKIKAGWYPKGRDTGFERPPSTIGLGKKYVKEIKERYGIGE